MDNPETGEKTSNYFTAKLCRDIPDYQYLRPELDYDYYCVDFTSGDYDQGTSIYLQGEPGSTNNKTRYFFDAMIGSCANLSSITGRSADCAPDTVSQTLTTYVMSEMITYNRLPVPTDFDNVAVSKPTYKRGFS